jgi:heme exporter protein B
VIAALRTDARVAMLIARKDALVELRGRHAAALALFFAGLVLLVFGFALGPDPNRLADAAPGLLWLALVFAGLLAVGRLQAGEIEDGALEELTVSPVARHAIYAGKALAGTIAMLVLAVLLLPAAALLYGLDIPAGSGALILTVILGAIGFAAVGTFYAGLTARLRAREALLPLLVLPVTAPLLLAAVNATGAAVAGDPLGELWAWIQVLGVFDVVMLVVCGATYGYLLEE